MGSYDEISLKVYGKIFPLLDKKEQNKVKSIYNKELKERIKKRAESRILGKRNL